jgi:pyridoxal phosphate enzyme (YggS family)
MSQIKKNLELIRDRINRAARRAGREPDEVRLVAVSKKKSADQINEAFTCGQTIFGENYLQEASAKIELLDPGINWHFIGHLQSNKAKYAVDLFDMIHSVDGFHLASAINKEVKKRGEIMPVLIQINISGEESKHGTDPQKAVLLIKEISTLENISVQGLMTMPPW